MPRPSIGSLPSMWRMWSGWVTRRSLITSDALLLNIDHHRTNNRFGTHHLINPDAAATAEILYDWIESMEIQWTKELATCVYTGLLTDTGGFRYSNTTPSVMKRRHACWSSASMPPGLRSKCWKP